MPVIFFPLFLSPLLLFFTSAPIAYTCMAAVCQAMMENGKDFVLLMSAVFMSAAGIDGVVPCSRCRQHQSLQRPNLMQRLWLCGSKETRASDHVAVVHEG